MSASIVSGHLTEADGRQLAVDMFLEFWRHYENDTGNQTLDWRTTRGAPQDTATLRRWLEAFAGAAPLVQEGFLQILSDYLALAVSGSVRHIGWYEEIVDDVPEPHLFGDEPQ